MRPNVKVESITSEKIPGKGWTVTETVSQAFINPKVLSSLGAGIADMLYAECYKESWIRKIFRISEKDRLFNLLKEVVDETTC